MFPRIRPQRGTRQLATEVALPDGSERQTAPFGPAPRKPRRRRVLLLPIAVMVGALAFAYTEKDRYTDDLAELSRATIGDEKTAQLEGWYFKLQDRADKLKYRAFGGEVNPFDDQVFVQFVPKAAPPAKQVFVIDSSPKTSPNLPAAGPIDLLSAPIKIPPRPFQLPETIALRDNLASGEGVWTPVGLPRTTPEDFVMARTFIRPDKSRPYAVVGVLAIDQRRIRLTAVPGTEHPGGDRGVKGAGVIPQADLSSLLVAFNGGFQGTHGGFGMWAEGREFRPLRKGLASLAIRKDGTMAMGEWGRSLSWSDDFAAVRQNAVLLVDDCEVSPRTTEGNDTWGYVQVNSAEFITWRSAVGLTKDGNLLVAAGNSLSAATLAQALWAAGACAAMQLDINTPYVLISTFFPKPDGSLESKRFLDSMPDSPARWFKTQSRDFFYVVSDERRYQ
ncbi:MAG: hypothetical protein ACKVVT_15510 [Dehalococcoidia bacterium]